MNWLLILVILIVAGNIAWGYSKGVIRVIYSLIAWIVMLVLVTFATPHVEKWIVNNSTIDEKIEQAFEEKLHEMVEKGVLEQTNSSNKVSAEEMSEYDVLFSDAVLGELLDGGEIVDEIMDKTGAYDAVVKKGTNMAMSGIAFLVTLVVLSAVFYIVMMVFDVISKLPLLEEANNLLGAAAGLVKGVLVVWFIFAVVAIESTTSVGQRLLPLIYESPVLIWLYENNLFLSLFLRIMP